MTVDFAWGRVPELRVAALSWSGPWSEAKVRGQFERVAGWAQARGVRTGQWIFREIGARRFEVAIELKGPARGSDGIRVRTLAGGRIARVVFDPDLVSPRLVYHGLWDWLRARRKDREIRAILSGREVYRGNPWTDRRAWARTEVQYRVRP